MGQKGYISSNVSFIDLKLPTSPPTSASLTTIQFSPVGTAPYGAPVKKPNPPEVLGRACACRPLTSHSYYYRSWNKTCWKLFNGFTTTYKVGTIKEAVARQWNVCGTVEGFWERHVTCFAICDPKLSSTVNTRLGRCDLARFYIATTTNEKWEHTERRWRCEHMVHLISLFPPRSPKFPPVTWNFSSRARPKPLLSPTLLTVSLPLLCGGPHPAHVSRQSN